MLLLLLSLLMLHMLLKDQKFITYVRCAIKWRSEQC